ncbi:MAG TPA: SLC13 family permease, partial [Xanthomonadales bacterium]|nr:SLC13 family permease [Xanthomonadales bacterium]
MDVLLVGLITAGAIVLFVRERFPPDVVAILVLGSLAVLGLVTPAEAISGFSNAAVITVAGMFVMSAGLRETGALNPLARLLGAIGITGPVLLIVMVLVV